MPRLASIQREWNALVPQAQVLGIRRVRHWNQIPANIAQGQARLDWLHAEIIARGQTPQPALYIPPITQPSTTVAPIALAAILEPNLAQFSFGVEIECFMPPVLNRRTIAGRLTDAGFPATAEYYNHTARTYWKVLEDGSLGDRVHGIEVVSPVLRDTQGVNRMRQVINHLNQWNITTRRSCGFHVHVDARGRPLPWFKNLLRLYGHFEDAIDTITARSRRGNINQWARSTKLLLEMPERAALIAQAATVNQLGVAYCGPIQWITQQRGGLAIADNYTDAQMEDRVVSGRYRKVNLASHWRHGTVEYRQHQGTVNADKAEAWLRFCLRMSYAAAIISDSRPLPDVSLANLANLIELPANELAYYQSRAIRLNQVQSERR